MERRKSNSNFAFWLTAIPGLLGLFGLGHLYLRRANRGVAFLSYSAILYVLLMVPLTSLWTILPAIWFVGWVFCMYDVRKVARRATARIPQEERTAAQRNVITR